MKIEVGQIWKVVKKEMLVLHEEQCECEHCGHKHLQKTEISLPVNIRIEIRYPIEWYYRTEANDYYHSRPEDILDKCEFFGTIHEKVRWNNNQNLHQILKENFYTPAQKGN